MMRAIGCGIAMALLALPAGAVAKPADDGPKNAAQECRAERAEIGVEAFREQHGANRNKRNAFGRCVRAERKERAAERKERVAERRELRAERRNAARDCRAERGEMGVEAFREQYGTNRNKRNAFGKCVSQTVKAEREDESEDEEPETELES